MMLSLHHFPHHYLSFHLFIIGAILLCCLCQWADCFGIGRKGPPPPQKRKEDADTEKAMSRTLNKMSTDGDRDGRFVLLICKSKCLKERAEIPNWIREFNSLKNRSKVIVAKSSNESAIGDFDDSLGFHFHFYRKPFPVSDIEKALKTVGKQQAIAFYIVGGRAFPMNGQISKKDKFMKWLDKFEQPKIIVLADEEMDGWLNSECHGHESGVEMPSTRKRTEEQVVLLVVHDPEFCPEPFLKNLARSLMNLPNSVVLEFRRPLTEDDDFIMHWRLHNIGENCQIHILLYGQYYLELDSEITGSELHQIVGNLTDNGNMTVSRGNCSASTLTLPFEMQKILPPLNPIEMEFLREERHLKAIEHNRQYLTVGAIGGVAVMALAMSIFWGLNGNDFVAKQARN